MEQTITIIEDDLAVYDMDLKLTVPPGEYTVRVGGSSVTDTLTTTVKL